MITKGVRRKAAGVLILVPIMFVAACTSPGSPDPSHPNASSSSSMLPSAGPFRVGADAQAVLDGSFTGTAALGSGSGELPLDIMSNTLADTPKRVLSISFAFVCTGNARVTLRVAPDSKDLRTVTPHSFTCDKSVDQQSVNLPKPGPVSFEAKITGGQKGRTFAYGYYPEKTQS